ncbi:MAG: DnaJ domain-containing protein [Sandaracinaceae bacterium]|nr:DnaJ domain-containing protein [Sandaracinaceae bacterium]
MSTSRLDQLDYYTLLGVDPTANEEQIRAAWRAFALKFHPDRYIHQGPARVEEAKRIYRRGSEAYETLIDPIRRKAYDVVLARGELRLTVDPHSVLNELARSPEHSSPSQATKEAPRSTPPPFQSPMAGAYYRRALEASQKRDWKTAYRMVNSALELEPYHPLLLEAKRRILGWLKGQGER